MKTHQEIFSELLKTVAFIGKTFFTEEETYDAHQNSIFGAALIRLAAYFLVGFGINRESFLYNCALIFDEETAIMEGKIPGQSDKAASQQIPAKSPNKNWN